jgi:hypothetical protein
MNLGRIGIGIATLGGSELLGEDTMSHVPVLNTLGGYESNERKNLLKAQGRMAAAMRQRQVANERARMNAVAQSAQAFGPQNQMMGQMFGPEAAFSPQQMASMTADPLARSKADFEAAQKKAMMSGPIDPKTRQRTGGKLEGWSEDDLRRMRENEARQSQVQAAFSPAPQGPAPLKPMQPLAPRRY